MQFISRERGDVNGGCLIMSGNDGVECATGKVFDRGLGQCF